MQSLTFLLSRKFDQYHSSFLPFSLLSAFLDFLPSTACHATEQLLCLLRHGSIPDALRSHDIPTAMKAILRCLQAVQGQIPCTDAARRMMRGELTSLITYFGCPSLFVTFNPADVLHPFTWRRGLSTPTTPLRQVQLDQHLLTTLRDANLWRMVALDPTAAVEAFHLHVNTFLSALLKVVPSAQQLPTDGIASIDGQGIFGPTQRSFWRSRTTAKRQPTYSFPLVLLRLPRPPCLSANLCCATPSSRRAALGMDQLHRRHILRSHPPYVLTCHAQRWRTYGPCHIPMHR